MVDVDWRGGASERSRSGLDSNPYQLTRIELDYLELMSKGFDPIDASRSLGISYSQGTDIRRLLVEKLNALNDNHLTHLISTVVLHQRTDRFAVLDNC